MPPLHRTTLSVSGMMCQNSCGSTVANALRATPGVLFAAASFATHSATVLHDAAAASVADLVDALDMVGFDAAPSAAASSSPIHLHTFSVGGMMCQNSCGATVARALRSAHPSVVAASASHARSSATCYSTSPSAATPCLLSEEIEDVGFEGTHQSSTPLGTGTHAVAIAELVALLEEAAESALPPPAPASSASTTATTKPVKPSPPNTTTDAAAADAAIRAFFSISGMSCASCSSSIEHHVSALPGVDSVKVALLAEKASVVITDTSAATGSSTHDIIDTVTSLGFLCVPIRTEPYRTAASYQSDPTGGSHHNAPTTSNIYLNVTGMSCASCSSKIERHISSLPLVESCSVSLLTGKFTATVTNPATTTTMSPTSKGPGVRDIIAASPHIRRSPSR